MTDSVDASTPGTAPAVAPAPRRETVTLSTADGPMPAVVSHPAGPVRGGVVVVQDAFGITDYLAGVCDELARAGYRAVAPALFHRVGSPVLPYEAAYDALLPALGTLRAADIMTDVDAAVALLADEGTAVDRCGILGFCMGGSVATYLGAHRPLAAAVSFYGGGLGTGRFGFPPLIEVIGELQAPWLGLFGDLDGGIPVDEVEAARVAAKNAAVPAEIVRYPNAGHGFHCAPRPSYEPGSAADAWARAVTWLDAHIPQ
jgi:carboxymethylenebutenolidase